MIRGRRDSFLNLGCVNGRARRPSPTRVLLCMKGGEIMANQGYAGKIGNAGSQSVKAPFSSKKTAKGTVQKGGLDRD